jgi:hypothetical protein
MSSQVKEEIRKLMDILPEHQLEKLLELMKQMRDIASATSPGKFDKFVGVISDADAAIMLEAVAERDKVDPNAW